MTLYDTNTGAELISTLGQDFLAMTHYLEIGFKIQTRKIFGFGERSSTDLLLKEGTYNLFPYVDANSQSNGQEASGFLS